MKINRKFKRKPIKDNKGYLKSNEGNYTPMKEISGGDITMDGVDIPILAIPMGEDGPMDMKFMNPGEDYEFGGATKTVEIPLYKKGGKSKWISDKISTLVKEGKSQKQAIAIAYSMYEKKMNGGQITKAQNGLDWAGDIGSLTRFNVGSFQDQYGDFGGLGATEPTPEELKRMEQERLAGLPGGKTGIIPESFDVRGFTGQGPTEPPMGAETLGPNFQQVPDNLKTNSVGESGLPASLTGDFPEGPYQYSQDFADQAGFRFNDIPGAAPQELGMEEGNTTTPTTTSATPTGAVNNTGLPDWAAGKYSQAEYDRYSKDLENYGTDQKVEGTTEGIADFEPDKAEVKDYTDETTTTKGITQKDDFQFFNPYAGVDIPSAAYLFGQNVGKGGNPLTAVGAGLKLGTGLARNIAAGVGNNKRTQYGLETYRDDFRKSLKGPVEYQAQDGGTLPDPYNDKKFSGLNFQETDSIPGDLTGDWVKENFFETSPGEFEAPEKYKPNMGRYKPVGYFKNPVVKDSTINLDATDRFPGNRETMRQYTDYLEEYNPGYKVNINYKQDGGTAVERDRRNRGLKFDEAQSIPLDDGSEMTGSWVEENFFATSPGEFNAPPKYKPNMGRYKPVGYFTPGVVKDSVINLDTTEKFPGNRETMSQHVKYLEEYNPGYKVNINYIPKKQEGGLIGDEEEVSNEAMMTGNYSTEDLNEDVNVEVEENEYILTPEGSLTKVLGDTHEKGGTKMNLAEGSMIISDHLKLGGKIAKKLTKALDTPVGSTDTYAKAMDKFYKKSGLQDIIDEEVEVISEVKKQKEKLAENEGKDEATFNINQEFLSGKLNELNERKQALMEGAKIAFGKVFDMQEGTKNEKAPKEEFQIGGQVFSTDQIIKMADEQGMDKDRALGMMRAMCGGKKKKYGGYKKGYGGKVEKMQPGGVTGASIGDTSKEKGDTAPYHNPDRNQALGDLDLYGGIGEGDLADTIKRNSWWFDFTGFNPSNKAHVKKFQTEFNKRAPEEAQVDVDGKFGIQTQSILLSPKGETKGIATVGQGPTANILSDPRLQVQTPTAKPSVASLDSTKDKKVKGQVDPNTGVYLMPGQEPMLPTGLIMPTKIERQYGRMDAERFTPDELLAEIKRSELAAAQQLDTLPSGTREAAIVKLAANSQAAKNKVISEVDQRNKVLSQQEGAFNIRQSDREVDAGAIDTMSYEQRAQGAMANTISDFERFFNESQSRNMANFRTIEDMNFMNALYENFDITPQGIKNTVSPEVNWAKELANKQMFKEAVAASQPPAPTTKKKATTAKKGGTMKRRRYKRSK